MKLKRAGAIAAVMLLGVALGGCVVFKGNVKVKQVGDKPKVEVKFKICNSDPDAANPRCPDTGNSDSEGSPSSSTNGEAVLLGFRVPRGTKLPDRIRSRTAGVEGAFEALPEYAQQLNDIAPRRDGYKWFGYSAPPFDNVQAGNDAPRFDLAGFKVKMRVPDRIVGERFKVRPVVGWYDDAEIPGGLDCGPDPFDYYNEGQDGLTICIDSPSRSKTRKSESVKIEPKGG
jgi:hypothetical protein